MVDQPQEQTQEQAPATATAPATEPAAPVAAAVEPEAEPVGIKETEEVLDLCLAIGKAIVEAEKNDGKIDLADAGLLLGVFPKVGPAVQDIDKVLAELKDLSLDEAGELVAYVAAGLALDSPKAKAVAAAAVKMATGAIEMVHALRS